MKLSISVPKYGTHPAKEVEVDRRTGPSEFVLTTYRLASGYGRTPTEDVHMTTVEARQLRDNLDRLLGDRNPEFYVPKIEELTGVPFEEEGFDTISPEGEVASAMFEGVCLVLEGGAR